MQVQEKLQIVFRAHFFNQDLWEYLQLENRGFLFIAFVLYNIFRNISVNCNYQSGKIPYLTYDRGIFVCRSKINHFAN